jgi:hypothetical protein
MSCQFLSNPQIISFSNKNVIHPNVKKLLNDAFKIFINNIAFRIIRFVYTFSGQKQIYFPFVEVKY